MHKTTRRAVASALSLSALCLTTAPGGAQAAGFSLPEVSAAGIGTANALVANPQETGAFAYNPSAMGFHDGSSLALGAILVGPSFTVDTANGSHDSEGADWVSAPMIQAAVKAGDRLRVGLAVNAPFGLETRWPYGSFPELSQSVTAPLPPPLGLTSVPTGNHPTGSKLEILDVVPSLAYRVNDNLSLGLGVDVYWARSAQLDSNLGQLNGDGSGLGVNLSALYRLDAFSAGIAYRSGATLDIDGMYTPQNLPLVMAGIIQPAQTANVELDLPWRLQIGARYAINQALALEVDWTRTGWSRFDTLEIVGDDSGALIFSDTNDWSDTNAYRLGVTYDLSSQTQLRLGYTYDETGQGDDHFSARVPDSDRQLFSIGIAQELADGYSVEVGYMYALGEDRDYRSATAWQPGDDVNGTDAIDGDYAMDAHLFGIELVKAF